MKQKLLYKMRYLIRKVCRIVGVCHHCGNSLNYTTTGRPLCTYCRH